MKAKDVKTSKSKVAAQGGRASKSATAKVAAKKAVPSRKPAAKKKVAVKKPVPKKIAKPVAKKAVAKPAPKKSAAAKKPVAKPVLAKKVAKPAGKAAAPAHKPVPKAAAAPAKPIKAPAPKPVAKPSVVKPAPAGKHAAPKPVAALLAGKTASPISAIPPRVAKATARHTSNMKQKSPQSSMNSSATTLDNGITKEDGRYALPSTLMIDLPKGYRPSSDEEYMNPRHLAYFRNKLRDWRDQLVEESRQTMENLRDEVRDVGDEAERATRETENSLELRTRDRYRKLISKIDKALRRIEEGRYGYCEETDEEIGLERLDARPIATLSLDAQERREHLQKQMGD